MPTFKSDYAFGMKSELESIPILETYFQKKLVRRGGFAPFDYDDGSTFFVELKTRRIRHNQFPTAIIPLSKVNIAKNNPTGSYYFVFSYSDGLFGIQYNKELFDTFDCSSFNRGERADFHNRPHDVVWIPHEHLFRIQEYGSNPLSSV